ncbi:MAG: hypothetical protein PVJ86_07395 [Phycisphaerales bacterium]|jgi:hypothetical protein
MSKQVVSSTTLLRWVLTGTLPIMVCGCSPVPWKVCLAYGGPERPLEEVAVLLKGPVYVPNRSFGKAAVDSISIDSYRSEAFETHLLPGTHSLTVFVHRRGRSSSTVQSITFSHNFSKGQVYEVYRAAGGRSGKRGLHFYHVASVARAAPWITRKRVVSNIPNEFAPAHWQEFVDRQSAGKQD